MSYALVVLGFIPSSTLYWIECKQILLIHRKKRHWQQIGAHQKKYIKQLSNHVFQAGGYDDFDGCLSHFHLHLDLHWSFRSRR